MARIVSAGRLRKSPYYQSTIDEGAETLLTYNNMLVPRGYGDREAEYWRLINGVSMWDVAVQRQVQLKGPDAAQLAQILCVRDLSDQKVGQGKYVAVCDHRGILINDPIAMKVADDCYWLSISNSDIWFWARCVAGERGLNVEVSEPDVSPMAVQGPKAEDVVASIFGDWVRELRYFWFQGAEVEGIPLQLVRAGWSKQGGFELFLMDESKGDRLWQIVKEAGRPFDIGPGYPNPSERTESGLLNYGTDTDDATNPFEVRMKKFVDLDLDRDVIGASALRKIKETGVKRHQLGVILEGDQEDEDQSIWLDINLDNRIVGHMTNKAWSYRLKRMIGYALVSVDAQAGDIVQVRRGKTLIDARLVELPFNV
ncbi:glycine cleavage system protein T [Ruegeria sp. R13_0]|uniref:glycine cleavage T C-terminal barrel domain-containing protein n=1 Tax=Ruegeria sp. R13_0 TaxID=2821099 RepID=UPI001ADBFB60|nr:glycine cleavage T C-terminal barrel domain-containing protein [Ruegeria sp. R13_0]MBO9436662.1 glycine cleavage system protein T [Ruegeria sp. R13_0]